MTQTDKNINYDLKTSVKISQWIAFHKWIITGTYRVAPYLLSLSKFEIDSNKQKALFKHSPEQKMAYLRRVRY